MGELLFDGLANLVDARPLLLGNSKKLLSGFPAMRARLSSEPISDRCQATSAFGPPATRKLVHLLAC
jgi:hypothetical protein